MNFKVLSVAALVISTVCFTAVSTAEKMPESAKHKESRIEGDLNNLFKRGLDTAALKLDRNEDVQPFAIIKRFDGSLGVFELDKTPKNEKMSVNKKALSVRRYLTEMAIASQLQASILVMYAVIKPEGEKAQQGLTFEMEHIDGVSLLRFLPVSDHRGKNDENDNKLVLHTESLSDTIKPVTVFTEMVKALQANANK